MNKEAKAIRKAILEQIQENELRESNWKRRVAIGLISLGLNTTPKEYTPNGIANTAYLKQFKVRRRNEIARMIELPRSSRKEKPPIKESSQMNSSMKRFVEGLILRAKCK